MLMKSSHCKLEIESVVDVEVQMEVKIGGVGVKGETLLSCRDRVLLRAHYANDSGSVYYSGRSCNSEQTEQKIVITSLLISLTLPLLQVEYRMRNLVAF